VNALTLLAGEQFADGSPSETAVKMACTVTGRDVVKAADDLPNEEEAILERGLDRVKAPNTVEPKEIMAAEAVR